MNEANQYAAPAARLDQDNDDAYGEVRPFSPSGRLGRLRYLLYNLLLGLAFVIIAGLVVAGTGGLGGNIATLGIVSVLYLVMAALQIILIIQRCHDINATGWMALLIFVPVVGALFALFLLFMPGTEGPNRYGPPPPPHSSAVMAVAVGLLLIVFIGGILAAIAVPAYNAYVERARLEQMR